METNTAQPTAASTVLVQSRNAYTQQQQVPDTPATAVVANNTTSNTTSSTINTSVAASVQKSFCPASASSVTPASDSGATASSSPASGGSNSNGGGDAGAAAAAQSPPPSTPKKHQLDGDMLRKIRELLMSPGGCNLRDLSLEVEPVDVLKERYLISSVPNVSISAAAASRTPVSYRHLVDLTSTRLKCTDLFTEEDFLCKIINEPLHKVQLAYFKLQQDTEGYYSQLYGHNLIREVRDIVPMSKDRTYVIIPAEVVGKGTPHADCVYEDLHTYVRNKRRLSEDEARALFYQICQTVQVCHRNGIILRDLKLKRFFFIDADRTKLQYESLEGCMILDDPEDDILMDKIGCPLYTAPELLCPHPSYNGKPADMWALGVILYTMIVGQYPFYEKASWNLIRLIRHSPVHVPSFLSRSVRCFLINLLRKNHADRIQADYIFMSPWLRKQQMLFVPADIEIPDDDDDEMDGSAISEPLDYSSANMQQRHDNGELHSTSSDVEMG